MTKLVDRPNSDRGRRRREEFIEAGLSLLIEGGWAAVTTRAVAARSEANVGLIHYHFGGLPGLRLAVAERAGEAAITPVVDALLSSPDARSAIDAMRETVSRVATDHQMVRLAVELVSGTRQDPALGEALRDSLREARDRIADWLGRLRPEWTPERRIGAATLVAALLDGTMLHRELDDDLPIDPALTVLGELIGVEP
ncbi:AcrR family transcriptional regulator [Mycobacterium frederiksbergense]|uniref:AcrR family transcriptional regulator n=1 Tax=Mycolicibacterium frederiksbergense TaxID=117567 RepID=A0ABT6L405_9MYCO|nr:TetR family transcriptional regulator [Mycolicibacterium frederiksbergense]MDH6197681.1 AcrR family transcriptional regulator [Mycolicibacterium frederiksbergense]